MHPKNAMKHGNGFFDWLADYKGSNGPKSAKAFLKRECRKAVRRDAVKDIKEQLDNG